MSYSAVTALLSKGISRTTLYEVVLDLGNRDAIDKIKFLCKNTRVPEITVDTIVANGHEAQGVVREQATGIKYGNPFSITVIADRDYVTYKAIRNWFDTLAINANPYSLSSGAPTLGSPPSQRIAFYKDVVKNIELIKLESNNTPDDEEITYFVPFRVIFNNAFPVRIGEITLAADDYNGKVEFDVDFAYETYTFDDRKEERDS